MKRDYKEPILHIVHCIDTEGPLLEDLDATFDRLQAIFGVRMEPSIESLRALQNKKIELGGIEGAVAKCFAPAFLKYNTNWQKISDMLDVLLSSDFRRKMVDDFDNGWVFSWHCMDHVGYLDNPRHKDVGYGNIFRYYKSKLIATNSPNDEINWHFHPLSLSRNPIQAATSFANSYDVLLHIICRRIIDDNWFPVVNRPGFHSERPDSHAFFEQWIPFDYANQFFEQEEDQPDISNGRFGDWRRAPRTWRGYNPAHDDYQTEGSCRRKIFRCLNVGTRLRSLNQEHLDEAFGEARECGSAILAFADHDYRDIRPDVEHVRDMIALARKKYPDVKIKFSGAEEAARELGGFQDSVDLKLAIELNGGQLTIKRIAGEVFGPQPFLSIKTCEGRYYHDNLDMLDPGNLWSYVFDDQTLSIDSVSKIGIGSAGRYGRSCVKLIIL